MAFGFLNSIIPDADQNVTLYTSPGNTLTQGKVSVSSKVTNPVRIRLSIRESGASVTDLKYLEYNRYINYGEVFETGEINIGPLQELVVRCDHPDVSFLLSGETIDESNADLGPGVNSGLLNTVVSTNRDKKTLYQVPSNTGRLDLTTDATVVICNLGTDAYRARIGLLQENDLISSFGVEDYIDYEVVILPNQTYTRPGIKLIAGESIVCSSSDNSNLQFILHGRLKRDSGDIKTKDIEASGDITARSITAFHGNVTGILTASSFDGPFTNELIVGSASTISSSGFINNTGIVTASEIHGDLYGDVTGIASDAHLLQGNNAGYYLDYTHFSNTPTSLSQFANNVGYITTSFTNTSQLTNDAGFISNNVSGIVTSSGGFESANGLFKSTVGQGISITTNDQTQVAITSTGTVTFNSGVSEKFASAGTTLGSQTDNSLNDGNVILFDGNESGNLTINFTDITSQIENGETVAFTTIITPNGSGRINNVQVDGVSQTISWNNGNTPVASASGYDVYTFSILRTGPLTTNFLVFGAKTNYA